MNRRLHTFALLTLTLAILLGCEAIGGGGASELTVSHAKVPEAKLTIKSGHTYATTKTFTKTDASGKSEMKKALAVHAYVSNQELDPSRGMISMGKVPASKEEMKVAFTLIGKEGTTGKESDAAPEVGTYSAKADRFMKVESVGILAHDGTKGAKHWFNGTKLEGSVEVTSASDGKLEGTIDVKDDKGAVKGKFTVTLGKGAAKKK